MFIAFSHLPFITPDPPPPPSLCRSYLAMIYDGIAPANLGTVGFDCNSVSVTNAASAAPGSSATTIGASAGGGKRQLEEWSDMAMTEVVLTESDILAAEAASEAAEAFGRMDGNLASSLEKAEEVPLPVVSTAVDEDQD